MTIAALVFSAIALVISFFAALFAYQQAVANRTLARIEMERHRQAATPTLTADADEYDAHCTIKVVNEGPIDLNNVRLTLLPPHTDEDPVGTLTDARQAAVTYLDLGPLDIKAAATAGLQRPEEPRSSLARIKAVCRAGRDEWTVVIECQLPIDVRSQIF